MAERRASDRRSHDRDGATSERRRRRTSSPPSPTTVDRAEPERREAVTRGSEGLERHAAWATRAPATGSPSPRRSTTGSPADEGARARQGRSGPGHARPRGDGQRAARVAAPLRRRGAAAGHGQRPAREPLRAPARARDEGREGRPAQGRPRLRARLDRHPHPRPDPGQEGGRGRGPEPAPPPGPPRRHLRRAAEGRLAAARAGSARTSPGSRSTPTWR